MYGQLSGQATVNKKNSSDVHLKGVKQELWIRNHTSKKENIPKKYITVQPKRLTTKTRTNAKWQMYRVSNRHVLQRDDAGWWVVWGGEELFTQMPVVVLGVGGGLGWEGACACGQWPADSRTRIWKSTNDTVSKITTEQQNKRTQKMSKSHLKKRGLKRGLFH